MQTTATTIIVLLSTGLLAACASPETQERAQAPYGATDVQPADVQRWLDAWNSRDMARIAALFTPDAVVHQPQNSQPMSLEAALAFFATVFHAFPDVHFDAVGVALGLGEAASWERVTGTMLGPMSEPATGQTWAPTGKRFEHVAAMRLVYAQDHRVREFWTIWDRAELGTQLALSRATAAAPTTGPITHADIQRWAEAWNSHDVEKVAALFTPDVAIDQPENTSPIGAAGIRPFFGMIFKAYPDFHVEVRQAIVDGSEAVSVEQVTGTWSGPFVDPNTGSSTPGNGMKFDHPGAMVLEYTPDHHIRRCAIYWDRLIVDHQLGITPK
jgi:steroid delta-isomerase-like uncharacterized protein